jgi:hypothetical protein
MSRVSKFLTDLSSHEAAHQAPRDSNVPQIKGRTAFVLIAALLLFLVVFTYALDQSILSPRMIDRLEVVLFGIASLAVSLRIYYIRKK